MRVRSQQRIVEDRSLCFEKKNYAIEINRFAGVQVGGPLIYRRNDVC
ncbi:hypothetical protein SpAn4DRAFT_3111 [Sporomusa ovata]|uniref:Uncharacterized protein n=1 Tax=Sporomusa ovata TaxID=2378 RepID=A0A0U1KZ05_9FIRM|nr:hypothetical protein SpAn4DRAFT_3111 [Sporomusa ovata]